MHKIVMSHRIVPSVSNMVHVTLLTALGYGIFVIHELRYYPHEPSYELCVVAWNRFLPLFMFIAALMEIPSTSHRLFSPELLCVLHDIADSFCDPNFLLAFLAVSLNSKSSGPSLINSCEFYAQCGFPLC